MPKGMGGFEGGRDLHGVRTDSTMAQKLLDFGNWLRYGKTEAERMDMVNKLSAPGVREAAYDKRGIYDPAAAERYTSAYLFGDRFKVPEFLQPATHAISEGSRAIMHKLGVPGVGEERPELKAAEELGMARGASGYKEDPNFNEAKPWESYHDEANIPKPMTPDVPAPNTPPASIADDPMRLAEELKLQKRRAASMLPQDLWND